MPKKKNRGLRRYYKNLYLKNDFGGQIAFNNAKQTEFYLSHAHFDIKGYGNASFKRRKQHLDKLFRHFDFLVAKAEKLNKDYQVWATLLDFSSIDDALFLHTEHPFPYKINGLTEVCTLRNTDLINYLKSLNTYKILYGTGNENYCVLFKENAGISVI